ncbi:outer membrane beta-barrel protein [Arcicella rosea]|uniref:outer membrane beta-barrel protein n=1 Tax=Arcicella rosea TaxID=502909 RepID=UPI0038D4C90E
METGLRAELTNVTTTLKQTNEVNPIDYANLFPSTHFTLNLANENALQISYSRRVRTIIEGVNFYSYRDFLPRQDKSI